MSLSEKKIGLIGVGNMGTSILEGLLSKGIVLPQQISVYDKFADKAEAFVGKWQVSLSETLKIAVKENDVLILAIKPQDFEGLAKEIKEDLKTSKIVISILAGTSIEVMKSNLQSEVQIVRAMPNLGAKVSESMTAVTGTSEEAIAVAKQIFDACGKVIEVDEDRFDLITALSGSGPAYFFLLMEIIEAKAIENGLSPEIAKIVATQTACGSSLLANQSEDSPGQLREKVTSKGGTTQAALESLDKDEIRKIFSKAFDAATKRSLELRGG